MDSYSSLKNYIEKSIGNTLTCWAELLPLLHLKEYKKDAFIVREKQLFTKEIFVAEGVVREFLTDSDQKEINLAFYDAPQIIPPYFTRNIHNKHTVNYQTLTYCKILLFEAESFRDVYLQNMDLRQFAFWVVEQELSLKTRKEKCFITQNATQRLAFFRETYPGLENKIAQQHIAAYLGISPVSLSRLRNT